MNTTFDIPLLVNSALYRQIDGDKMIRGDEPTAVSSRIYYFLSDPYSTLGYRINGCFKKETVKLPLLLSIYTVLEIAYFISRRILHSDVFMETSNQPWWST
jgi:hypothetical protein